MKYKVEFNIDVAYPKGRISGKNGSVEIDTDKEIEVAEMKEDNELKMAIFGDIQPKIKTGKIFNVEITTIQQQ